MADSQVPWGERRISALDLYEPGVENEAAQQYLAVS